MTDKEVGELWAEAIEEEGRYPDVAHRIMNLIRKLVEQAAITRWYAKFPPCEGDSLSQENINFALERFGIDPATWEK